MCGIVAVVRRPPAGAPPELTPLLERLDAVAAALGESGADGAAALRDAAATIQAVGRALRGPLGTGALIADPVAGAAFDHRAGQLGERLVAIEAGLDGATGRGADDVEALEQGRQLGGRARRSAPNDGDDPAHGRSSVGVDPAIPAVHPVRLLR